MLSMRHCQIIQDSDMVYTGLYVRQSLLSPYGRHLWAAPVKCMGLTWLRLLHPDDLHGLPKGKLQIGA